MSPRGDRRAAAASPARRRAVTADELSAEIATLPDVDADALLARCLEPDAPGRPGEVLAQATGVAIVAAGLWAVDGAPDRHVLIVGLVTAAGALADRWWQLRRDAADGDPPPAPGDAIVVVDDDDRGWGLIGEAVTGGLVATALALLTAGLHEVGIGTGAWMGIAGLAGLMTGRVVLERAIGLLRGGSAAQSTTVTARALAGPTEARYALDPDLVEQAQALASAREALGR